jgi:DNA-binding NtrC family response regulator
VHSEPGQGTRFEVLFPQIVIDKRAADKGVESIPTGTESILFVDDEEAVAETGKSILERLGYRVEAHTDPQKALDKFSAHGDDFDLVITDKSMPCLTGEELSKRLMEIRPDIPILLCTGYSDQIDAASAAAMGIKKFLKKPLEMGKLANIIRQVLDEDSRSLAS